MVIHLIFSFSDCWIWCISINLYFCFSDDHNDRNIAQNSISTTYSARSISYSVKIHFWIAFGCGWYFATFEFSSLLIFLSRFIIDIACGIEKKSLWTVVD